MGYAARLQVEAFAMYCRGRTVEQIVAGLQKSHALEGRPRQRTVDGWMESGDWRRLRQDVHQGCARQHEPVTSSREEHLMAELTNLRSRIMDAATELKFKSAGEAVRSLANVQKIILESATAQDGSIPPAAQEQIIKDVFQVMCEDPEVAAVLARREAKIMTRLKAILQAETSG
jgi:hypothetical protein